MADITNNLLAPFLTKFTGRRPEQSRLDFLAVLLGTLVDLYLVTEGERERKHSTMS